MKSISARQFRTSFADLTESVMVLRRDKDGNFQVLGEWSPASGLLPAVSPQTVAQVWRPVPKPSQAKR